MHIPRALERVQQLPAKPYFVAAAVAAAVVAAGAWFSLVEALEPDSAAAGLLSLAPFESLAVVAAASSPFVA